MFPEQLSGVRYQSTAWWVSALEKQLQPTNLEGRRGPSGSLTVVQEPALAPLANIALLCIATWGRVPERRERITGKAVVGKLSTVCEQCPQVSHERSNKGGGK